MYLKKTWKYGNRVEVRKYHTYRYGVKGEKRAKREKPTPKKMAEANERRARKMLKRLLIGNFKKGDWHLTLTYAPDKRPAVGESKQVMRRFIAQMRKLYRAEGIECKYIMVTEWEGKHLHHHLVINDCPGIGGKLADLWAHGGAHLTALYADYDYEGLADYLVKETAETFRRADNPYKQRWTRSRNLALPEEHVEVIKANHWKSEPKASRRQETQGYVLDKNSVESGEDVFGYPYLTYVLIYYPPKTTEKGVRRC